MHLSNFVVPNDRVDTVPSPQPTTRLLENFVKEMLDEDFLIWKPYKTHLSNLSNISELCSGSYVKSATLGLCSTSVPLMQFLSITNAAEILANCLI